ncbi:TonB-dependent receptor [Horticoccus sp. 23ND18S-11]|uniref:TonB-dependent receptor n=1 Tax=Horticoccus sp. 23ND18S-11 TaxID=3391832 RepID=UPI0039C91763
MIRRYPARFCFSVVALFTTAANLACPNFGYAQSTATTDAATGRLTGQVSNGATRALLEGAAVEIPALGRRMLTDTFGRFVFDGLPAGNHAVSVTYIGLNREERLIPLAAGQQLSVVFDLGADVYRLEKFSVVGEREGNAAALTAQRNADSVKSVVALDAYGNLSNSEAGELLIRLPGIAGSLNSEGVVSEVLVRGTNHTLNSVTVDGNKMASSGGMNRNFRTNSIPGAFFDTIEVTKAATPDMDADSLGGNINMKTRSPLSMKEKRRMIYRFGAKWAPFFYDHNPATRNRPLHPMTSFSYQEVFDAFGGNRNLGITFSMFYSENAVTGYQLTQDYAFTVADPAYVWDYRSADIYNNRQNKSATLKIDYRFSPTFRVFLNGIYNDAHERSFEYLRTRAFTARTLAPLNAAGQPTGNNAILADFTNAITRVRPVAASTFELQSDGNRFEDSQRQVHAGAEHTFKRFTLDYDTAYSESIVRQNDGHNSPDVGSGGFFRTWLTGVGWTLDKTVNPSLPVFTQTAGPSIFDLRNYTNSELNKRDNERNGILQSASANAKYHFDARGTTYLKGGVRFRRQSAEEVGGDRRWQYAGPDGVLGVNPATGRNDGDLSIFLFKDVQTSESLRNGPIPYTHVGYAAEHVKKNPTHWIADPYYDESRKFIGTRKVVEDISSAYLMTGTRWRQLRAVAGVRFEETEVTGKGFVRSRTLATAAAIPDPVLRARTDYNNPRRIEGRYSQTFPGAYLTYTFSRNLLARANWSNSIGRPPFANLVPREDVNDQTQTLTVGNPALKPQFAENIDFTLEYYFEPVGAFSVGVFRKDLKDFIVSLGGQTVPNGPDNGFGGSYGGYNLITDLNAGRARIDGIELSYQQQLTFLPAALKRLSFFANYTRLTTEGDYGSTGPRTTNLVPNFVPSTANAGLSFPWRKLRTRLLVNYTGEHLVGYSTDASRLRYKFERTAVNLNLSYVFSPKLEIYCDLQNMFNAHQEWYYVRPNRVQGDFDNGAFVNFGISGRF